MLGDVALPIQKLGEDRDEIIIVYFDGFIKNETQGMLQIMLQNINVWIRRYPELINYNGLNADELYHETMLFRPYEMLYILSNGNLSEEELNEDLEIIIPQIELGETTMTTFEFALYRILQEKNINQCYFFKDTEFYENEIEYINKKYKDVLSKIDFVNGGLLTLYSEVKPTTIFIHNMALPITIFPSQYSEDELMDKMFILLNSAQNLQYNDEIDAFEYTEEFANHMKRINDESSYGLLAMFNFPLVDNESEEQEDDYSEEEYDEDSD